MDLDQQEELILHLKNKTEKGFKLLYELYGNKIFNLAYKILGNKEDAGEITQETIVVVYRSIEDFRGESRIFTWIYTIAKNLSFRYLQNKKRSSITGLEELIEKASSDPEKIEWDSPHSQIEKRFYIEQVKEGCLLGLLRCLSLYQRASFIFHILLNISLKDVSVILNKSENATRTLIHRARLNIKKFLCKNCSLYNEKNGCKCENLINFSLKNGWIQKYRPGRPAGEEISITGRIENEISDLKKITMLYQSIPGQDLPADLIRTLQKTFLKESVLFSISKVK